VGLRRVGSAKAPFGSNQNQDNIPQRLRGGERGPRSSCHYVPLPSFAEKITSHRSDLDGEVMDGMGDKNQRIMAHSRTRLKAEVGGIIERPMKGIQENLRDTSETRPTGQRRARTNVKRFKMS